MCPKLLRSTGITGLEQLATFLNNRPRVITTNSWNSRRWHATLYTDVCLPANCLLHFVQWGATLDDCHGLKTRVLVFFQMLVTAGSIHIMRNVKLTFRIMRWTQETSIIQFHTLGCYCDFDASSLQLKLRGLAGWNCITFESRIHSCKLRVIGLLQKQEESTEIWSMLHSWGSSDHPR